MKKTIFALLASLCCLCGQSAAAEPSRLRVLCYNIHYGQGNDGQYDVKRLAAVINKAKPDLVALQEVDVGVKRSGRVHQARRLAEAKAINRHFGGDNKLPTILAGDMNAVPDSEPIRELLKHWSNATDKPASPTAPSKKPTSRIDYIFYRPASMFRVTHAEVVPESMASDHRPVLAVFEISVR